MCLKIPLARIIKPFKNIKTRLLSRNISIVLAKLLIANKTGISFISISTGDSHIALATAKWCNRKMVAITPEVRKNVRGSIAAIRGGHANY